VEQVTAGSNFRKGTPGPETESLNSPTSTDQDNMSDFKKSPPKHNPVNCCATWHLWRQGLALAIYQRAGALTNGGKTDFFAKRETIAKYFGANYEATRRAFLVLINNGWLEVLPDDPKNLKWIDHEQWAFKTNWEKCIVQDLNPWHGEADPFIGRLFAVAGGRFRTKPHWILGVRQHGWTDEEILELFRKEIAAANEKRGRREYHMTGKHECFYRVAQHVKRNAHRQKQAQAHEDYDQNSR
jgi:hypothetical protein